MRILLSSYYYPPSVGGLERQSHLLARALVARGHSVHVLAARLPGFAAAETLDGVTVERLPTGAGSRWSKMGTYLTALSAAIVGARRRFDLLQVQQALYPAATAAALQPLTRLPLVVRNAGSGVAGAVQLMQSLPFGAFALRQIAKHATTISLTDHMTDELRRAGFTRIEKITNGTVVPAELAEGERDELRRQLQLVGTRTALYVGRLEIGEKDLELLLRAFQRLAGDDLRLLIVGDGGDRRMLEAQAASDTRIRFCGAMPNPARYLQAADAFVLPSRSEGVSNALLEAMSYGLPAIATNVGGNREVIADTSLWTIDSRK